MNLEEMIRHLKIAATILISMANVAEPDSPSLTDYADSAEVVNRLISHFELLQDAMEKLEEPAEQVAVKIPNTEFPIYVDLHKSKTESQIEDQEARYVPGDMTELFATGHA